jgi:hypothetical protein
VPFSFKHEGGWKTDTERRTRSSSEDTRETNITFFHNDNFQPWTYPAGMARFNIKFVGWFIPCMKFAF